MQALKCRNGHLCFSAAERPDGGCPECGDESFSLVTVKEEAKPEETEEMFPGRVITSIDGAVVARHRKRGTGYTTVVVGHGGMATATSEAGAKYNVQLDRIEFLPQGG